MDYYESVVFGYLRADRSLFVNTEYCIQLGEGNPDKGGRHSHWYCDAAAADIGSKTIYLCECSYSTALNDLIRRLKDWNDNWLKVCGAIVRDSNLPSGWSVRPWLFVPEEHVKVLLNGFEKIGNGQPLNFKPRITTLEMVQPWKYKSWSRVAEKPKPECIPAEMRD